MPTSATAAAGKRVLVVQRSLSPPGGGNAVAAWMVHALAATHDVSSLTLAPWSVGETNAFYGTAIPEAAVTQLVVPAPWRWLAGLNEAQMTRLRMCAVLGQARRLAGAYDLLISADNFAPFPKPGIQYVYFPALLQPPAARLKPLVDRYFTLCDRVLGGSWSDALDNVTLVTSRWTARGLEGLGELKAPLVLYPPVVDPGDGLPWSERDDTFLCIGRFTASKRIEMAMAIVGRARAASMPRARLLVVGSPVDRRYTDRIRGLASRHGEWIEFREDLSREALNGLMRRSRFGIQAMEGEHFGMATAEMTRAGCLVFAHDSGGTPEVLDNESGLLWSTEDEAVRKIVNAHDIEALRARLKAHAKTFSPESFVERFRAIVDNTEK